MIYVRPEGNPIQYGINFYPWRQHLGFVVRWSWGGRDRYFTFRHRPRIPGHRFLVKSRVMG